MSASEEKWYFNPTTGDVVQGAKDVWDQRMGPYDTREEAANALKIARERVAAEDAKDAEEDNWGKPASWES